MDINNFMDKFISQQDMISDYIASAGGVSGNIEELQELLMSLGLSECEAYIYILGYGAGVQWANYNVTSFV